MNRTRCRFQFMNLGRGLRVQGATEHQDTHHHRSNFPHDWPPNFPQPDTLRITAKPLWLQFLPCMPGSANCWICTSVFAGGFEPTYFARTAATSGARNSEMLVTKVVIFVTWLRSAP